MIGEKMSTVIYFSGTGNCYHVAKAIAEHQGAKLISVTNYDGGNTLEDDMVGIVTPVYCGELPPIVKKFMDEVIIRGKYIWSLAVCGGGVGTTFQTMDRILRYNENRLSFGSVFLMPDNSIVIPQDGRSAKVALENEETLTNEFCQMIDSKIINKYPISTVAGKTSKIQWASLKAVLGINKKKVNIKTCTDCRICVDVCPNNNIEYKGGDIIIGKNCTNCFACMHWCPTHSIKAGRVKVTDKNRYTHPSVSVKELIENR